MTPQDKRVWSWETRHIHPDQEAWHRPAENRPARPGYGPYRTPDRGLLGEVIAGLVRVFREHS
ncbi:hypothetical protein [Streptomyces sp. NPDC045369]|uniref:hypothetical protein n=1 Tax=Streptomyces sp. NPDC045369 TaxID=3155732 RepID=UPI0033F3A7EA